MFRLLLYCLTILALIGGFQNANSQPAPAIDDYTTRIQPIFDNRCVACHSCYNAPCQLNLQSHAGLTRGATKLNVYDRSRLKSVRPPVSTLMVGALSTGAPKASSTWLGAQSRARRC